MRIGLVVDSACDLPLDYLQQHFTMLPITVKIGYAVLAHRPTIARMAGVVAIFAVPAGDFLLNITR